MGGALVMSGLFGLFTSRVVVCAIKRNLFRGGHPRESHVGKSRLQGVEPFIL